ncbi:MAG: hypothetical protein HYR91_14870 [Flavobacteriia bacterium]|nr:hypothetical protein [Flavobacteriia bacterium]
MENKHCPCCSGLSFNECCEPLLSGKMFASTSKELMCSRFTAYVLCDVEYIYNTTLKAERINYSKAEIEKWSKENNWLQLEIIESNEFVVEFKAYFQLKGSNVVEVHHEKSTFVFENCKWYYAYGVYNN